MLDISIFSLSDKNIVNEFQRLYHAISSFKEKLLVIKKLEGLIIEILVSMLESLTSNLSYKYTSLNNNKA